MNVFEYDGTGSAQSVVSQPSVSALKTELTLESNFTFSEFLGWLCELVSGRRRGRGASVETVVARYLAKR